MKNVLLLFILITVSKSALAQNVIELPLTYKEGYGPFSPSSYGTMIFSDNHNNPLKGVYLKSKGAPIEWGDAKFGQINLNLYQVVYQNFWSGNISNESYEMLRQKWSWTPDTLKLSKNTIRTSIAFVDAKDSSGTLRMIVDANNNLDFSDDKVFTPSFTPPSNVTELKESSIVVTYDKFVNNEVIIGDSSRVVIYSPENSGAFMYNFPGYAVAELNGEEIAICSDDFFDQLYETIYMVVLTDTLKQGGRATQDQILEEYITIKGKTYKSRGVDIERSVLVLEEVEVDEKQIYSSQIGFKAPLFKTENFITKDSVALEDFRGKYLYIDFWALWCGPCIAELPHLKKLYDKVDKSQIELLGVVVSSGRDEDRIEELMDKHSVNWTHVLSNKSLDLQKLYNVTGLPTTILLDRNGQIIAKDISSEELEKKLKELLK